MSAITKLAPACQSCGGNVHLEVDFVHAGAIRIYAECRDCYEAGWMEP